MNGSDKHSLNPALHHEESTLVDSPYKSRRKSRKPEPKSEETKLEKSSRSDEQPEPSKPNERKKVKKSKREASDKSKRSSGDDANSIADSEGSDETLAKKSTDSKRRLKKTDSNEKRKLKTRKSSKNKEAIPSPKPERTDSNNNNNTSGNGLNFSGSTLPNGQMAPGTLVSAFEELAFGSDDEPPMLAQDSDGEEGSIATSTTNIRTLASVDHSALANSSNSHRKARLPVSPFESDFQGKNKMIQNNQNNSEDREGDNETEERQRLETMEVSPSHHDIHTGANRAKNHGRPTHIHHDSDSDDGEVTWDNHKYPGSSRHRSGRPSSSLYDGFSSAHSSDSEGVHKRSYIKSRNSVAVNEHRKTLSEQFGSPNGTFRAAALDERIKINVGGRIFETFVSTLRKYPHTLLGTMLHPRNAHLLNKGKVGADGKVSPDAELFFDRNPRVFEVILDFYRTSTINRPPDISWEMLQEELSFFQIDLPQWTVLSKRVSVELRKMEYKDLILPASEYRKMTRVKLLKEHHSAVVRILDFIQQKIQRKADSGHNTSTITFYSPLHYTNSTPREVFKVISTNEIRELLVELLRSKDFIVKETNEYSKTKTTSIIGLHDQVINYNDPQYFSFHIKW